MNEYEVAHAKALEMNSALVYIEGHGNRAYQLLNIAYGIATVRPLSKGMEWSHDAYKVIRPLNPDTLPYCDCSDFNCSH